MERPASEAAIAIVSRIRFCAARVARSFARAGDSQRGAARGIQRPSRGASRQRDGSVAGVCGGATGGRTVRLFDGRTPGEDYVRTIGGIGRRSGALEEYASRCAVAGSDRELRSSGSGCRECRECSIKWFRQRASWIGRYVFSSKNESRKWAKQINRQHCFRPERFPGRGYVKW